MRKDNNTTLPHFKTIALSGTLGIPALATHELIYHWLISKIIMPLSINKLKDLKLANANTGTLTEIGQQADLVVRWRMAICLCSSYFIPV